MELLREISDQSFGLKPRNTRYVIRRAARAIVLNGEGSMALMHATKLNYYKLPGGGIEGRETIQAALHREVKEETGCQIKEICPIGVIIEYRSRLKFMPFSYCFIAKVIGAPEKPKLTEREEGNGFVVEWFTVAQAVQLLIKQRQRITNYAGRFMSERDLLFTEKAASWLRSHPSNL